MSDLAATSCGCNGGGMGLGNGNCSCSILLWVLILSCVCGGEGHGEEESRLVPCGLSRCQIKSNVGREILSADESNFLRLPGMRGAFSSLLPATAESGGLDGESH